MSTLQGLQESADGHLINVWHRFTDVLLKVEEPNAHV